MALSHLCRLGSLTCAGLSLADCPSVLERRLKQVQTESLCQLKLWKQTQVPTWSWPLGLELGS